MKSIIVLGNPRSGTSMTAGILSILGVSMGESSDEMKDNEILQSPKGFYENTDFINLTRNMHRELEKGQEKLVIEGRYTPKIQRNIALHEKPLWGFKSAAVAPFLPMFTKQMGNVHRITTTRNIIHNDKSWMVHMRDLFGTDVDFKKALDVMSENQREMLKTVSEAPNPNLFITYEDLKKDPWSETIKLAEFLDISYEGKKEEVKEFILPNYTTL